MHKLANSQIGEAFSGQDVAAIHVFSSFFFPPVHIVHADDCSTEDVRTIACADALCVSGSGW